MRIKIWGCRGSIPSPGKATARYGGNTTCLEVRLDDGTLVVIDAGTGIRPLGNAILEEPGLESFYLLLTHAHWDHVQGFPFFVPAYRKRYTIRVRSGPAVRDLLEEYLAHQLEPPYFPVAFRELKARFDFQGEDGRQFRLGAASIQPFALNHPNGGYGYRFLCGGRKFVFLTDTEVCFAHPGGLPAGDYLELARNADLLLHDGQYNDEEYEHTRGWGHSTFRQATEFAVAAGVRRLGIFHHDPVRRDPEIDRQVQECRRLIGERGSRVRCFGVREGMEFTL